MTTASRKSILRVESLEARETPSGVDPANGREFGTSTIDLVQSGVNIGRDICSIEKGDCAQDALGFLNPPGHR